jgi:hypothetical protein
MTADVVRRCSDLTPADPGYFATDETRVADERNVLTGDYALVDPSQAYAQGDMAVHVEAFPEGFGMGMSPFMAGTSPAPGPTSGSRWGPGMRLDMSLAEPSVAVPGSMCGGIRGLQIRVRWVVPSCFKEKSHYHSRLGRL